MKRLNVAITNPRNPSENASAILGVHNSVTPDNIVNKLLASDENPLVDIDVFFRVNTEDDSSVIDEIAYNFATSTLQVNIDGRVYEYDDVPADEFIGFVEADSKGRYYNSNIKKVY